MDAGITSSNVLFLRQQRLIAWRFWWRWFKSPPQAWSLDPSSASHQSMVRDAFAIFARLLPGELQFANAASLPQASLTVMGSLYELAWRFVQLCDTTTVLTKVVSELEEAEDDEFIASGVRQVSNSLVRLRGGHAASTLVEDAEAVFFSGQLAYVALASMTTDNCDDVLYHLLPECAELNQFALLREFDAARSLYESNLAKANRVEGDNERPTLKRKQSLLTVDPFVEAQITVALNQAQKMHKKMGTGVSGTFNVAQPSAPAPAAKSGTDPLVVLRSSNVPSGQKASFLAKTPSRPENAMSSKKQRSRQRISWLKPTVMNNTVLQQQIAEEGASDQLPTSPRARPSSGAIRLGTTRVSRSSSRSEQPVSPRSTLEEQSAAMAWKWSFETPLDAYAYAERFVRELEDWFSKRPASDMKRDGVQGFLEAMARVTPFEGEIAALHRLVFSICEEAVAPGVMYDPDFLACLQPFIHSTIEPTQRNRIDDSVLRRLQNNPAITKTASGDWLQMDKVEARILVFLDAIVNVVDNYRFQVEEELAVKLVENPGEDARLRWLHEVLADLKRSRLEHQRTFARKVATLPAPSPSPMPVKSFLPPPPPRRSRHDAVEPEDIVDFAGSSSSSSDGSEGRY